MSFAQYTDVLAVNPYTVEWAILPASPTDLAHETTKIPQDFSKSPWLPGALPMLDQLSPLKQTYLDRPKTGKTAFQILHHLDRQCIGSKKTYVQNFPVFPSLAPFPWLLPNPHLSSVSPWFSMPKPKMFRLPQVSKALAPIDPGTSAAEKTHETVPGETTCVCAEWDWLASSELTERGHRGGQTLPPPLIRYAGHSMAQVITAPHFPHLLSLRSTTHLN